MAHQKHVSQFYCATINRALELYSMVYLYVQLLSMTSTVDLSISISSIIQEIMVMYGACTNSLVTFSPCHSYHIACISTLALRHPRRDPHPLPGLLGRMDYRNSCRSQSNPCQPASVELIEAGAGTEPEKV